MPVWIRQEVKNTGTAHRIAARDVSNTAFLNIFCNSDAKARRANTAKARRWWSEREHYLNLLQTPGGWVLHSTTCFVSGDICRKRCSSKAMPGRGRKLQAWVEYCHLFLNDEFDKLLDLGVKVTKTVLRENAVSSLTQE